MANDIVGSWRVVEMELWDLDAMELLGPAFLTLGGDGFGHFRFVVVEGDIDWRHEKDPNAPVHFTWEGTDEGDAVSGRGWLRIDRDGSLLGRIYFHRGDNSGLRAIRDLRPIG